MLSVLSWASLFGCMNDCINVAWHRGHQAVALLISFVSPIPRVWRKSVAWSPVWRQSSLRWFGLQCHLLLSLHCVFWGPQSRQQCLTKTSYRVPHVSFCWQALWRCWFHIPAGLGSSPHCQRYWQLLQWPWGYCVDWPANWPELKPRNTVWSCLYQGLTSAEVYSSEDQCEQAPTRLHFWIWAGLDHFLNWSGLQLLAYVWWWEQHVLNMCRTVVEQETPPSSVKGGAGGAAEAGTSLCIWVPSQVSSLRIQVPSRVSGLCTGVPYISSVWVIIGK